MKNIAFLLILFITSCNSNDKSSIKEGTSDGSANCNSLPASFASYSVAVSAVESAEFAFTDEANTSKSSWIRAARYYSCDNISGYFLIETDRGNYLHQGVPVSVWESFKTASSFGSFYSSNIRDRYRLMLN